MILYTQNGRWVGTQAEAKREFGEVNLVDVPTDKAALLEWLNFYGVGNSYVPPIDSDSVRTAVTRPHPWQSVREMAEVAELGQAIREDMKSNHAPEEPKDRVMTGEELCYFVWETVTAWANEEYLANGPEVSFDERYQENAESWIKDLQEFLGVSS